MLFTSAAALLSIVALAVAQSSVPGDLSSSFDTAAITLQVLYPALVAVEQHGIPDGTTVSQKDASKAPQFALGDSSSISTQLQLMIMLVDTTSSSQRMLHFLQTGFKPNQDATAISSSDNALVPYTAPGTLGEPGGKRQYSWLAFQQPKSFKSSGTFGAGDFDVASFIQSNNLQGALAGVGMFVSVNDLAGATSSPPAQTTQQQQQPPPAAAPTTTVPLITINPAPSSSTTQQPTFSFDAVTATATTSSTSSSSSSPSTSDDSTSSTPSSSATSDAPTSSSMTMTTSTTTTTSSTTSTTRSQASASSSQIPSGGASTLMLAGRAAGGASFMALPIAIAVAVGLLV